MKNFHPFHMVDMSPWPFLSSLLAISMTSSLILWMHKFSMNYLIISYMMMFLTMFVWWRDTTREASFQGHHSTTVIKNMKLGMILFIISEVMFFISFFWTFFHSSLAPSIELGMSWPPKSIMPFNPFQIPLLNTIILLSSGVSVTWTHHSIIMKNFNNAKISLMMTLMLGMYFTLLQAFEYMEAPFSISDSVMGSAFFVATGFHGIHVIIGSSFLLITLMRMLSSHFNNNHHFGFEAAAWYWHFVDVVWLFLYSCIYWWGN